MPKDEPSPTDPHAAPADIVGYAEFEGKWGGNARLAWDALAMKDTPGIPTAAMNVMDHGLLEQVAGHSPGSYRWGPERVYLDFQLAFGACLCDQWIPTNPLTMGEEGLDSAAPRSATTGAEQIVRDGIVIDSPEAVVEHLERFVLPSLAKEIAAFPPAGGPADAEEVAKAVAEELAVQRFFGPNLLKAPYNAWFPYLDYYGYGYENYLMAYALYQDVIARWFVLQADRAALHNARCARAIQAGRLPAVLRLDHDMADARGTLVSIESLDRIWLPQFARSIAPLLRAGVRLLWHCDGNLMQMVPRLIEAGVAGFQGFQYEHGMDYERICRTPARDGGPLMIWAGVSVTTTLPRGRPQDVKDQLAWLVRHGPPVGLFLGASSSIVPNTNRENVRTLLAGLEHYRKHGRA